MRITSYVNARPSALPSRFWMEKFSYPHRDTNIFIYGYVWDKKKYELT